MNTETADLFSALARISVVRVTAVDFETGCPAAYKGQGVVTVVRESRDSLRFEEMGSSILKASAVEVAFHNALRWTIVCDNSFRLFHLRYEAPVELGLFRLAENRWKLISPHRCGNDSYGATMRLEGGSLTACWTVTGPKKSQEIQFRYDAKSEYFLL